MHNSLAGGKNNPRRVKKNEISYELYRFVCYCMPYPVGYVFA